MGNPAFGFVGSSAAGAVQWALMAKLLQRTVASNTCAGACNYDWHLHDSNGSVHICHGRQELCDCNFTADFWLVARHNMTAWCLQAY